MDRLIDSWPTWLRFLEGWPTWLWAIGVALAAIAAGLLTNHLVFSAVRRIASRTRSVADDAIARRLRAPGRLFFPLIGLLLVLPVLPLPANLATVLGQALDLGLTGSIGWLIVRSVEVAAEVIEVRFGRDPSDNLQARRVRTQIQVFRRIAIGVVAVITLGIMLMSFPSVRHLGVSLFASAGIAGLVAGMAARPALSNLIAGIQIALTQPIRIEDVVIVENEWGWIEEIGTTYVVVRIWDLRRLVVPLSYFIEQPFQNWTRRTTDLLGTVTVYVDYTVPVDEVRRELLRTLQSSGLWDGKAWGLQVTEASEQTVGLRALMSAPDSGRAWDLRCYVRERLIAFLQERYPEHLPKTRAEIRAPGRRPMRAHADDA
jgi:small-conductance mechanosensitive channel